MSNKRNSGKGFGKPRVNNNTPSMSIDSVKDIEREMNEQMRFVAQNPEEIVSLLTMIRDGGNHLGKSFTPGFDLNDDADFAKCVQQLEGKLKRIYGGANHG